MYEDYEVHKTRPAWDGELIAVLKNGNKGRIVTMTAGGNLPTAFQVLMSENGTCTVSEREIDHYLTPPKPKKLPDHPGLWKDKDGRFWLCIRNETDFRGGLAVMRIVAPQSDVSLGWCKPDAVKRVADCANLAPFTELEVKEKQ
ncbi:hypothetical protein BW14_07055 [Bifidobacterium sp. UTBIF-68]|uniref:hypothetical protein n=1 Tax=Bifidobacterium sp. UTBIF-68 TaxID=1465262 RepID=UPI0011272C4B|nr:hypothetical protein [Bifidobacterium sp. UTBIF-68]TPF92913.1 hypothetical protein BW14_07055 [Bifidobacterium sp. UTBIF-68]